ncbi:MAG: imidazolonepropionase-like amidohydrolase [Flavobacteriales bacterium]|jgi:imidazolonepropionase-like amidohydrolase
MRLTIGLLFLGLSIISKAQETFPHNGAADKELVMQAFTHCTVHIDWETVVEDATLLIHRGKVIACGSEVQIPKGALIEDLSGMDIYPGFIDLNSSYGQTKVERGKWDPAPQIESNTKGAFGWNQAVKPEFSASQSFTHNTDAAKSYRSKGFGTVLTQRKDGIIRGTGSLVTLGSNEHLNILIENASANYSFRKGSSRQKYPSSLMGSAALLRQSYYDLDWYNSASDVRETNLSLSAWNSQMELPQLFETGDKWDVMRADKIGDEFNSQYIFLGNGDEYQRIDDITATDGSFVIPVNYPAAYDVSDPFLARMVSLTELMHWENAARNLSFLTEAQIAYSITSEGTESGKDFFENLRKAMVFGVTEADLLKALTYTPAALMQAENIVGKLAPGMQANFLICSGPIFEKGNEIYENWVQGERFVLKDRTAWDLAGQYNFTLGTTLYELLVEGKPGKNKGSIQIIDAESGDTSKVDVTIAADRDQLNIKFNPKDNNYDGLLRLSGMIHLSSTIWDGTGQAPDGSWFDWVAVKQSEPSVNEVEDEIVTESVGDSLTEGDQYQVIAPFMAYGRTHLPEAQTILIRNATIWTCEEEGIIEKAELLIRDGKIAAVGRNIDLKSLYPKEEIEPIVIDAKGKHISPGIIDEHSHIAVTRGVNEGSQASSAEVQIASALNPEDVNIYRQLAGGVTCSQLLHGSANPIGGQSALIKLRWGSSAEEMLVKNAAPFIKFALGENVKQSNWGDYNTVRFPQTRMGVEQVYYDLFIQAAEYDKEWRKYKDSLLKLTRKQRRQGFTPEAPRRDLEMETLAQILRSERFVTCHSYRQDEINMLMHVADSMGFTLNTFTHILEGYKVADKMVEHGAGASTFSDWWAYKYEVKDAIPYNGAMLHEQGIITAFNSDDAEMARRLNQEAAKAVKYGGVSEEEALKFVTLNPAKLLHIDDRMGSIKVGKDADFVIWSDNPLSIYAQAERTFIDGRCYYSQESDLIQRKELNSERARLIQKMMNSDEPGEKQKPRPKNKRHYHCDSEFDESND